MVIPEVLSFIFIEQEDQAYRPHTLQSVYRSQPELIEKYGTETLRLVQNNTFCNLTIN